MLHHLCDGHMLRLIICVERDDLLRYKNVYFVRPLLLYPHITTGQYFPHWYVLTLITYQPISPLATVYLHVVVRACPWSAYIDTIIITYYCFYKIKNLTFLVRNFIILVRLTRLKRVTSTFGGLHSNSTELQAQLLL